MICAICNTFYLPCYRFVYSYHSFRGGGSYQLCETPPEQNTYGKTNCSTDTVADSAVGFFVVVHDKWATGAGEK
ncbi:hypothetical protein BH11BAC7_BH11BAC7_23630 [soil metagenome]